MIALLISILIQLGIINCEQQYYNATPTQQQQYQEIIEDDLHSF